MNDMHQRVKRFKNLFLYFIEWDLEGWWMENSRGGIAYLFLYFGKVVTKKGLVIYRFTLGPLNMGISSLKQKPILKDDN